MSIILEQILEQAANGSPATVALSSESVAVLFFASGFIDRRISWLDKEEDQLDEVTDADWDTIEKLVGNLYQELMTPVTAVPIGSMVMWFSDTIPDQWLEMGSVVSKTTYPELFDIFGFTYGGGGDMFQIPTMAGYSPFGAGAAVDLGDTGGADSHNITTAELPAHNHAVTDPGHTHPPVAPQTNWYGYHAGGSGGLAAANQTRTIDQPTATGSATTGISTQNTGGGNAISLLHPVRAVNFIIYAGH